MTWYSWRWWRFAWSLSGSGYACFGDAHGCWLRVIGSLYWLARPMR